MNNNKKIYNLFFFNLFSSKFKNTSAHFHQNFNWTINRVYREINKFSREIFRNIHTCISFERKLKTKKQDAIIF